MRTYLDLLQQLGGGRCWLCFRLTPICELHAYLGSCENCWVDGQNDFPYDMDRRRQARSGSTTGGQGGGSSPGGAGSG